MYLPKHFEQTDTSKLRQLVEQHPLGTWVATADGELVVNHLPFLFDEACGDHGMLTAHVARANPVWKSLSPTTQCIVIFQDADAYVTPSFYPTKQESGQVVPTWNYATVHVHGIARAVENRDWLRDHVGQLTDRHESAETLPWSVNDAPVDYIEKMLEHVVGIEIEITKIVGKWKASQNKPRPDQLGVARGLRARGDPGSTAMARLVREQITKARRRR